MPSSKTKHQNWQIVITRPAIITNVLSVFKKLFSASRREYCAARVQYSVSTVSCPPTYQQARDESATSRAHRTVQQQFTRQKRGVIENPTSGHAAAHRSAESAAVHHRLRLCLHSGVRCVTPVQMAYGKPRMMVLFYEQCQLATKSCAPAPCCGVSQNHS